MPSLRPNRRPFLPALLAIALTPPLALAAPPPGGEEIRLESSVTLDRGRLSILAERVPLGELLDRIGRVTGLVVESERRLARPVTLDVERTDLASLLRRLLDGEAYLLRQGELGPGSDDPPRLWIFASGDAGAERESVASPTRASDDRRLEALRTALADGDPEVRLRALSRIADVEDPRVVEAISAALAIDPDPSVREEAVYLLGELGDDAARLALERALLDVAARVREAAIVAFGDLGGEESVRALSFLLTDADPTLRQQAVHAIGEIGGPLAIEVLARALSDEEGRIRAAAAEVLRELDAAGL